MKWLVDAQLPYRLAEHLRNRGYDVLHTLDLPDTNRTSDSELNRISLDEQRIVISKDADFVSSFVLQGVPYKLCLIATGNIRNADLLKLFDRQLSSITSALESADFVELSSSDVIVYS